MLLIGKSTISITIFNSYVKLPEGFYNGYFMGFHWMSFLDLMQGEAPQLCLFIDP